MKHTTQLHCPYYIIQNILMVNDAFTFVNIFKIIDIWLYKYIILKYNLYKNNNDIKYILRIIIVLDKFIIVYFFYR